MGIIDEGGRGLAVDCRVRAAGGSAGSCYRWVRRGARDAWQSLHAHAHAHAHAAGGVCAQKTRTCRLPAAGADATWGTAGDANATAVAALDNTTKAAPDASPPALPSCRDNCTECAHRLPGGP
jgi:hypothetical protein